MRWPWKRTRKHPLDHLADDIRDHLDREIEENIARGMSPEAARSAARKKFGNVTQVQEDTRTVWIPVWMDRLRQDLSYALRKISAKPLFSLLTIVSLALGIGANTAIFSFANAILIQALPVAAPERLVSIRQYTATFRLENCCFQYAVLDRLRQADDDFEDLFALRMNSLDLTHGEQTERISAEFVTGNYFSMLGVSPARGRLLNESDNVAPGTGVAAVISYALWQERFGGRDDIVGTHIELNGRPFQIVGVSQQGFRGFSLAEPRDVQVSVSMLQALTGMDRDFDNWATIIARLNPEIALPQAVERLNVTGTQVLQDVGYPTAEGDYFILSDASQGTDQTKQQLATPVTLLLGLVGAVLLIACANIAALLLARSTERGTESGLRLALGASRWMLFRQMCTESLLLAVAGGAAGVGVALMLMRVLLDLTGTQTVGLTSRVSMDPGILAFTAAITLGAAILFGTLPALRAARIDPLPAIRGGSVERGKRGWRLSARAFIAAEIALSLTLLFVAGLFGSTLRNLRAVDLGFQPENLIRMGISIGSTPYSRQGSDFFEELRRRAAELPEVRSATVTTVSILSGPCLPT